MSTSTRPRFVPFSGIGAGFGLGIGCGGGLATGVGSQGFPIGQRVPGFGLGGGCGIGLGAGWGFFILCIGVPFKRMEDILGRNERLLENALETLRIERKSGKRPPFGAGLPDELRTNDPFLDRVIRAIVVRRAKMKDRKAAGDQILLPK